MAMETLSATAVQAKASSITRASRAANFFI